MTSPNLRYTATQGHLQIDGHLYRIEEAFRQSILFLRIEPAEAGEYQLRLSIKSKQAVHATLAGAGEPLLQEAVRVQIPADLFKVLGQFQTFRRGMDTPMRVVGWKDLTPSSIIALENQLSQLIFDTFFSGDIGQVCADFIQLLEEKRIEELLLAVSTDDENIINLPFEMVLPRLFPPKMGQKKNSLATSSFGLVRTQASMLEAFRLQGTHSSAAPLKMLFITALPENLTERGKMLEIEEEQTRLIQSIGALEATGDKKPKIVIEFLENASLAELNKALQARQHDIVHISGHGAYHAGENKGVLYFENEDGDEEQIEGKALGETLRQHACVKLLILSACETAIAGSEGGVTQQVAQYGVPGILAMRFAVTDEGAKVFTTEFYTQLAKGQSLTGALAYAREALLDVIEQKRQQAPHIVHLAEWFTPVVYQNQAIGPLIDQEQPYLLPDHFYPQSSFLKTQQSRLIGEGFIGRKRYLIQLRQAFRAGRHVCLHGLGGLGKTTLAEAYSHHYDNHSHIVLIFRKGHQINEKYILDELLARLEEAEAPKSTIRQLKAAIEDPQTAVLTKLQLLIDNYLQGRKTILVFDNAEDVQTDEGGEYQRRIGSAGLSAFLRHLCQHAPKNCHILFTTRYKIEDLADVMEHLALDKMGYAEQYRLLNYSGTLRDIPLRDRDDVYSRLDGHPRGYEYLEALLKKDKHFTWQQVSQVEADVFENLLLTKVYERLSEPEKSLFQIVAVFSTRTPPAALAAVSGLPEAELLPMLQSFQDWSLCFVEIDGGFETHRLTREWMRQYVTPAEHVKAWALKAGVYFRAESTLDDVILAKDYFELAEAWEEFAEASFNIQGFFHHIGMYQRAFELNEAVLQKNIDSRTNAEALNRSGVMLLSMGQYDRALGYLEQSLFIMQQIGNLQGEGANLNNISQIHAARGNYDTALQYLRQALFIHQQFRDQNGAGATLDNIGQIYLAKGDYATALQYLKESLIIRKGTGNRQGEGTSLNNISQIHAARGDYDTALRYLEQSLAICKEIGDRQGVGAALNNLGQIYNTIGDSDAALQCLEQSLSINQQIGDRQGEGSALNAIGQIHFAIGDYDTALRYLEQSLAVCKEIGELQGEGATLNNIGQIYVAIGKYEPALQNLEQSLSISQQIGGLQGEGATLNSIGQIYVAIGNYDSALRNLEQSLAIFQQIGDRKGEGAALNHIGQVYHAKGDYDSALQYFEKALAIAQQIGVQQGEGMILNNISLIYQANGNYDTALQYLEQSLAINQQIGDRHGESTILNNISQIYKVRGDYDTALRYLEKSLIICQQIGNQRGESAVINNFATIAIDKGAYDTALQYLEQSLAICQQIGDRQSESATLNNIGHIHQVRGDNDISLQYFGQSFNIQQQIGDMAGLATTLNNIGAIYFEQKNDLEKATGAFLQSYQIFQQLGSPNIEYPASYLQAIFERIGEAQFQALIAKAAE